VTYVLDMNVVARLLEGTGKLFRVSMLSRRTVLGCRAVYDVVSARAVMRRTAEATQRNGTPTQARLRRHVVKSLQPPADGCVVAALARWEPQRRLSGKEHRRAGKPLGPRCVAAVEA
jgi:hypothetical protein